MILYIKCECKRDNDEKGKYLKLIEKQKIYMP